MQVKENTNIVQSNFLLENRPKLTKDETRLFLTIIGAINKDDEDFKPLEIPVSEFADLWGMEIKTAYNRIKTALHGLIKKDFFVEGINEKTGKMRFLAANYISMATYEEGDGFATVEISQMFKPYLLALKENYTRYVLENIMSLSTVNAIRNYELLKQYQTIGSRTFSVEDYKKRLGIEKKYSLNADLKRYVLDAAVSEINKNTDIFISYEFIGRGPKARIKFTINENIKLKALPAAEQNEDADLSPFQEVRDFEEWLMDVIPEEVHGNDTTKIRAIRDIAEKYITTNFLDYTDFEECETEEDRLKVVTEASRLANEDRNEKIISAIQTFTIREYNVRKKGIKTSPFAYFKAAFDGWLMNNIDRKANRGIY